MAGKRDEVFVLGEEQIGADPWSAPEEEPTARAPIPGALRSPRPRLSKPLILGGLVLLAVLVFVARPGDDPVPPRAAAPVPEVAPIGRAPRQPDRPHSAPEPEPQRPRSDQRRKPVKEPEGPAPPAETASAPALTYAPEVAPEPAPEPTPAPTAPPLRPEFGIER